MPHAGGIKIMANKNIKVSSLKSNGDIHKLGHMVPFQCLQPGPGDPFENDKIKIRI